MPHSPNSKYKSFTAFRSAAEEHDTKRENDAVEREKQSWENEGGHMSSTAGRVKHVPGSLAFRGHPDAHHARSHRTSVCDDARGRSLHRTEYARARRALSSLYDRPASDFGNPNRERP